MSQFNRVKNLKVANEIWKKLMKIHEGTSTVKEAKLYLLKGNFSEFTMKKDESIAEMFNRLNDIVNDLKGLGFEVIYNVISTTSFLDVFWKDMTQL